ncbi:MAG: hypothetical protein ACYC0X_12200 [Pirellulaceae bacterium]
MPSMSQLIEYLGITRSLVDAPVKGIMEAGEPVIMVTVRPDPIESFRPHNLAITQILSNEQVVEWLCTLQAVAAARPLDFGA